MKGNLEENLVTWKNQEYVITKKQYIFIIFCN